MVMFKAVVIDDELAAVKTLCLLIEQHIPEIQVISATTVAEKAIKVIEAEKPEIVFLDINMRDMDGFTFLNRLGYKDFHLVVTTAHKKYAIQAIKNHASDYLLKPIDVDELKQAVETIIYSRRPEEVFRNAAFALPKLKSNGKIGLPVKDGMIYRAVADINWIESNGNYCTFHACDGQKYVTSKNIGEYEDMLPEQLFFRTHKSYIVNIEKVRRYIRNDGNFVQMEDGTIIEMSRRKKDEFLDRMSKL